MIVEYKRDDGIYRKGKRYIFPDEVAIKIVETGAAILIPPDVIPSYPVRGDIMSKAVKKSRGA